MQTFLPYKQFAKCAKVLDSRRLNKQILEAYQIHHVLTGKSKAWRNHPAVLMWKDVPIGKLVWYLAFLVVEYEHRTGKKHAYLKRVGAMDMHGVSPFINVKRDAPWLTPSRIRQYRSLLLRKDPKHYRRYWKKLRTDIPFVWPNGVVSKS